MESQIMMPKPITTVVIVSAILFLSCAYGGRGGAVKARGAGGGFSFRLIHRDSIHSVTYPGNLTSLELHTRLLRYSSVDRRDVRPEEARPMVQNVKGQYYIELRAGDQNSQQHLLMDTGSSLVWFQCAPCDPCFPQDLPLYALGESRTFEHMSCDDPLCAPDGRRRLCDSENHCVFRISYSDGTGASGPMGRETLLFEDSNGGEISYPRLGFGCTNSCSAMFASSTAMSGIVGLNRAPLSLTQQLGESIGYSFSHCLVPMLSTDFTYLRFGDDIPIGGDYQATKMVGRLEFSEKYYVVLRGITFNGVRLAIPAGTFSFGPNGSGGVMIDTGAWYGKFIEPAHQVLRKAVLEHFAEYRVIRKRLGLFNKLLCFKADEGQAYPPSFPEMTLQMGDDAEMVLHSNHIFITIQEERAFCLAIRPWPEKTVIGAMQMVNRRIVYDLGQKMIVFSEEDCATSG